MSWDAVGNVLYGFGASFLSSGSTNTGVKQEIMTKEGAVSIAVLRGEDHLYISRMASVLTLAEAGVLDDNTIRIAKRPGCFCAVSMVESAKNVLPIINPNSLPGFIQKALQARDRSNMGDARTQLNFYQEGIYHAKQIYPADNETAIQFWCYVQQGTEIVSSFYNSTLTKTSSSEDKNVVNLLKKCNTDLIKYVDESKTVLSRQVAMTSQKITLVNLNILNNYGENSSSSQSSLEQPQIIDIENSSSVSNNISKVVVKTSDLTVSPSTESKKISQANRMKDLVGQFQQEMSALNLLTSEEQETVEGLANIFSKVLQGKKIVKQYSLLDKEKKNWLPRMETIVALLKKIEKSETDALKQSFRCQLANECDQAVIQHQTDVVEELDKVVLINPPKEGEA